MARCHHFIKSELTIEDVLCQTNIYDKSVTKLQLRIIKLSKTLNERPLLITIIKHKKTIPLIFDPGLKH